MPYLEENNSAYDKKRRDGLRKDQRVLLAMALRDVEKMEGMLLIRDEVKRLYRRDVPIKRIARWLKLTIEEVEEHLAAWRPRSDPPR